MSDPYRKTCPECDALRAENSKLKADAASIWRRNLFGAAWRFFCVLGAMCVSVLVSGYIRGEASKPDPPETCHETAEIITVNGSTRICQGGGRMETELLPKQDGNQQVLVRCRCGSDQADAGHE